MEVGAIEVEASGDICQAMLGAADSAWAKGDAGPFFISQTSIAVEPLRECPFEPSDRFRR